MELMQISAGRGPLECSWIVGKVFEKLTEAARKHSITVDVVDTEPDRERGTYKSVVLSLTGDTLSGFCPAWIGTVQWTAQSPFRPHHKRKNWFVSVNMIPMFHDEVFSLKDVKIETMRSSGAGGQHVNKTESGVRVTHIPSKTVAVVTNERSQHQNKSIALALLAHKIKLRNAEKQEVIERQSWQNHNELIRGNPVMRFQS